MENSNDIVYLSEDEYTQLQDQLRETDFPLYRENELRISYGLNPIIHNTAGKPVQIVVEK